MINISSKIKRIIYIVLVGLSLSTAFTSQAIEQAPQLQVESAMAVDGINGQILFEQDSNYETYAGELSKILLVYLVYQAIDQDKITLEDQVSISDQAYRLSQDYDIANVPLRQDFTYSVGELLQAIAITQANGASLALAEYLAGSEANYLTLADQQLSAWELTDYHLVNSTGLPSDYGLVETESIEKREQNRLSAEALAVITYQLLQAHPEFLEWTSQPQAVLKEETDDAYQMTNYNDMIVTNGLTYEGMQGLLQTNTVAEKGNFLGVIERNHFKAITIVLGAETPQAKFKATERLGDYVFGAYALQTPIRQGDSVTQIPELISSQGETEKLVPIYSKDVTLVVPMIDTTPRYSYQYIPNAEYVSKAYNVKAPLKAGANLGEILITLKTGRVQYLRTSQANRVPIELNQDLKEAPWYTKLWRTIVKAIQAIWHAIRRFFVELFN